MKRAEIIEAMYQFLTSEDNNDLLYCAVERAPANLSYFAGVVDYTRWMVQEAEADDER